MGGSGLICLPTSSHLGQSGGEVAGLPVQENQPNPTEPAQPTHTTIQSDSTQESAKPKSTCVAPRASAIRSRGSLRQWQHELRLLREDQPD